MVLRKLSCLVLSATVLGFGCNNGGGMQSQDSGAGADIRYSRLGESCLRTADCADLLVCIDNSCSNGPMPPKDGGSDPVPLSKRLGGRGESCVVVADCVEGMTCRPRSILGGGNVCDFLNYPIEPTGKVCGGECLAAADCCQLPPGYTPPPPAGQPAIAYASCEALARDIVAGLGGTSASQSCANIVAGNFAARCFTYATYCQCSSTTWSCERNRCVYADTCTADGVTVKGCPAISRASTPMPTTICDKAAMKCQPPAPPAPCSTPASCDGKPISDLPNQNCAMGECTCHQGACYRRCTEELDCRQGYTCDTGVSLCKQAPECTKNDVCINKLQNVAAECTSKGTCALKCTADWQCGESGAGAGGSIGQFTGNVCGMSGYCENVGCSSDSECKGTSDVKLFCVQPSPVAPNPYQSALTDGR